MSDEVEVVQEDAEALAEARAGYNKGSRAEEAPAPAEPVEAESPAEEVAPEPTETERIAADLASLKQHVAAIKSQADPTEVRKLYGEIGNINRTLKDLQQQKSETATNAEADDLQAALDAADKVALDYEEVAGPLVKAVKALAARAPQQQATSAPVDIDAKVEERVKTIIAKQAVEALTEEHADWASVRGTQEFKEWLGNKPLEYQTRMNSTWNVAAVSKMLDEFKAIQKTKATKQQRLSSAVTPQGIPTPPRTSVIPDEEGFMNGYNRGPKRHQLMR